MKNFFRILLKILGILWAIGTLGSLIHAANAHNPIYFLNPFVDAIFAAAALWGANRLQKSIDRDMEMNDEKA